MPTTRRSTGSTRGRTGPTKGQSTLSFSNKVTKSVPKDIKKATLSPSLDRVELPQHKKPVDEEKVEEVIVDEPISQEEVEEEQPAEPQVEQVPEKPEAEVRAESISDSQINKYWKAVEKQRTAPRIHQEDLQQSEKILRYFDVSSQYGVSTGSCLHLDALGLGRLAGH